MPNSNSNSNSDSISDDDNSKSKNHVQHLHNSSFTVMDMLAHGQVTRLFTLLQSFE
jgi:hypothetical protein